MDANKYNMLISRLFEKVPFSGLFDFAKKEDNVFIHELYMLDRTLSIFKWEGLPDTVPDRSLEIYLQVNGHACFTKVEDGYYVFSGSPGGEPDPYYMPTLYTVSNPALNFSKSLKISEDCIMLNNDAMFIGLMPLFNRHASLLAENELSFSLALINARIIDLISATDDRTRESAEQFLEQIAAGKMGIIAESYLIEGLKTLPYASTGHSNTLTQLIEFEQYEKAAWFNDIGLNANYNMKREALSSAESQLNDDALRPLIDDMLKQRKIAAEKINELYGLSISVELNSVWKENEEEAAAELETLENEADPADPADPEDSTDPEDPADSEDDNEKED